MTWNRQKIKGVCSVCGDALKAKGFCDRHYRANKRYGNPTFAGLKRQRSTAPCAWPGCTKTVRACGYCSGHYKAARREGLIHREKYMRDHPLYGLWWARRKQGVLSPEWIDDFPQFLQDIGTKPGKFYSLITLREGPFGPDNFEWRAQIKRQPGESRRAFHARKWQAQVTARPAWDRNRQIVKRYGITLEEYEQMFAAQKGVCAICKNPETKLDIRHGTIKQLAVDHCHNSKKVRGLLCQRCNIGLGRIGDSIEIARAMVTYLIKHKD